MLYPAPPAWSALRAAVLERAGGRCEGSPAWPDCRAANREPHPVTGSRVVLTIGHLDHDPTNSDPANLRAWCQRCHNTYDAAFRRRRLDGLTWTHWWRVRRWLPERHGYPCRVLTAGRGSVLLEFADGHRTVSSRYSVRRRPPLGCAGRA